VDFFFNPSSIAIVGASPVRGKLGNNLIVNIRNRYPGPLYLVNPKYPQIEGLDCYPSVSGIGKPVDLVIVMAPAPTVPAVIQDCASAGAKGVIIESAGFAEIGEQGKALEDECRRIARESGVRVWGPNCYGVLDGHRNTVFAFGAPEFWERTLVPGGVSLIVQSGMLASTLLLDVMSRGVTGFAKACSIGNRVDVDETDLLEYLLSDPDTTAIALYLEAVPRGRKFIDLCRSADKPIVVLKGGSSPQGAKAAISHTASLAGDDRIVRGALAQAQVIQATDILQMVDLAHALSLVPQGVGQGRVAVLTLSGGAGILCADLLYSEGLGLADLSADSLRRLGEWFPSWMPAANPIDLMPAAPAVVAREAYRRAAEIACADPGVDALLIQANVGSRDWQPDMAAIGQICRDAGKAAFAWVLGEVGGVQATCAEATRHGIPAAHELDRVVQSIRAVRDFGRHRSRVEPKDEARIEPGAVARAFEAVRGAHTADEFDSKRVLAAVGIPTVSEAIVADAAAAVLLAESRGYPVVLKGLLPGKAHKTEQGLVLLGLRDGADVRRGFADLRRRMNGSGRILVQQQEAVDWEFFCGMVRDPFLGPAVAFGLGGVTAELHKDVVFRVAPLTRQDAFDIMDSIRSRPLLDGFRGKAAVDRDTLARVLVTLGQIGLEAPWVSEIDINPLASVGGRLVALDATIVVKDEDQTR
jgi:acyl-CoA synthetase (NDP forming)